MSGIKYLFVVASSVCVLAAPVRAQLLAAGAEFQVNIHTTGNQRAPVVAAVGPTTHVVVWRSDGQDGDSMGVFARRLDDQGNPISGEFQVNTHTTGDQEYPAVAGAGACPELRRDVIDERFPCRRSRCLAPPRCMMRCGATARAR